MHFFLMYSSWVKGCKVATDAQTSVLGNNSTLALHKQILIRDGLLPKYANQ